MLFRSSAFEDHARSGFLAAAIYPPTEERYRSGIKLPGGIAPEDWDIFCDFVVRLWQVCGERQLMVFYAAARGRGDTIGVPGGELGIRRRERDRRAAAGRVWDRGAEAAIARPALARRAEMLLGDHGAVGWE